MSTCVVTHYERGRAFQVTLTETDGHWTIRILSPGRPGPVACPEQFATRFEAEVEARAYCCFVAAWDRHAPLARLAVWLDDHARWAAAFYEWAVAHYLWRAWVWAWVHYACGTR